MMKLLGRIRSFVTQRRNPVVGKDDVVKSNPGVITDDGLALLKRIHTLKEDSRGTITEETVIKIVDYLTDGVNVMGYTRLKLQTNKKALLKSMRNLVNTRALTRLDLAKLHTFLVMYSKE